jgi:hypothetical protein
MRLRLPLVTLGLAGAVVVLIVVGVSGGLSPVSQLVDSWRLRPRVLAGDDAFETVTVTERASVRQAGEFDGQAGQELAIVEFGSVQFVTAATLAEQQRLELGGDLRSHWPASARLARVDGALAVVDTGGGLDDTRVRDLAGTERWRYRPDEDIPASSLVPADLDGDGSTEFYATIRSHAVRLDASGQEVWRAPFSIGRIVATAGRTARHPAWIVAEGQGETVVWDSGGARLASLTMKDARPLAVVDWADGRYLLAGGPALRAVALDGRVVFEWAAPGMTVVEALPLALEPGAPRAVALVASSARGSAVGAPTRWRVQIVSRDGALRYDEIVDTPTELLAARGADGVDRLFLNRAGLLALRRRSN